jgi:hypothetical protein
MMLLLLYRFSAFLMREDLNRNALWRSVPAERSRLASPSHRRDRYLSCITYPLQFASGSFVGIRPVALAGSELDAHPFVSSVDFVLLHGMLLFSHTSKVSTMSPSCHLPDIVCPSSIWHTLLERRSNSWTKPVNSG